MARHLDLEEQEQLDELKHFWAQWGSLITWLLIAVFGSFAAWNGWNYWQRHQAVQASVLYDEVDRAIASNDSARVEQAFADLRDKFGRTTYAQQAGLLAAKALAEQGKLDAARDVLAWVADKASGAAVGSIARLRLAALLAEGKKYDEALQQLASGIAPEFQALAADRRGDIYQLQGKKDEARAEYTRAWKGLGADSEYRPLVEVKLTALGVNVESLQGAKS